MPSEEKAALAARRRAALDACGRTLVGHRGVGPEQALERAAQAVTTDALDRYGEGGEVAALEAEVAALLGKPAAVLMPSGIMAQQAALRAWCDRSASRAVAVHALSHLVLHELGTLTELHGLRVQHLTTDPRPSTAADLEELAEPLAAVAVELPLRDAGYLLPDWDELVALSEAARARGVPLHLDGARIWESQPFYDRPLAEIAALADSVYVSFYKGLGGLAGAVLAGPEDLVAQARRWQWRHGGRLFSLLPYAVLARHGLRTYLPRMAAYRDRAVELAAALARLDGVRVLPDPPRTNGFRVFVDLPHERLETAGLEQMEQDGVAVSAWWRPAEVPGWSMTEVVAGEATLEWDVEEQVAAVAALLDRARGLPGD